ncbi:MAG: hypothetical protein JNM70_18055 [Anaerolineae bacterium]|nr:hypothetical protein [Anaerolineae bacterium]
MLTEREIELLSLYLDSALSESERAALEARLQTDAELRGELESLRETVTLLRTLPSRRAPRNFTLSASQATRSTRWMGFPTSAAFSALSAAAAFLLFIGASLLLTSRPQVTQAPAAALAITATASQQPDLLMQAPIEGSPVPSATAEEESQGAGETAANQAGAPMPTLVIMATSAPTMAAPVAALPAATDAAAIMMESAVSELTAEPMAGAIVADAAGATGTPETTIAQFAAPTEVQRAAPTATMTATMTATPLPTLAPATEISPAAEQPLAASEPADTNASRASEPAEIDPLPVVMLGVGLVLLALAVITTAVRLRKR